MAGHEKQAGGLAEPDPGTEDSPSAGEEAPAEDGPVVTDILLADSGQVLSDAGSGLGKPGTDNEDWRLKEKQFTPQKLVDNARAEVGSDKWYPIGPDGRTVNKCNIFVADKLHESGAPVPNVGGTVGTLGAEASDRLHDMTDGRIGGQPPSASDWYKGNVPGYEQVKTPRPGDIASDGRHVGFVSGQNKTISVTTADTKSPEYGRVVENSWGFRPENKGKMTFWRRMEIHHGN